VARIHRDTQSGALAKSQATKRMYLLSTIAGLICDGDVESRFATLEAQLSEDDAWQPILRCKTCRAAERRLGVNVIDRRETLTIVVVRGEFALAYEALPDNSRRGWCQHAHSMDVAKRRKRERSTCPCLCRRRSGQSADRVVATPVRVTRCAYLSLLATTRLSSYAVSSDSALTVINRSRTPVLTTVNAVFALIGKELTAVKSAHTVSYDARTSIKRGSIVKIVVWGLMVATASISFAQSPKALEQLQRGEQLGNALDALNMLCAQVEVLAKKREADCAKPIGYAPFCNCGTTGLPVAWSFAEYIAITTRNKEENIYPKMTREYKDAYDKVASIRDMCVKSINAKRQACVVEAGVDVRVGAATNGARPRSARYGRTSGAPACALRLIGG